MAVKTEQKVEEVQVEEVKAEEVKTFDIQTLEYNDTLDITTVKNTQLELLKNNPFVKITDSKTFAEAKKSRTALKSGRTDIQKSERVLASKIKMFRDWIKGQGLDLISITQDAEDKQQAEIDSWEKAKAEERQKKIEAEAARVKAHEEAIKNFRIGWQDTIDSIEHNGLYLFTGDNKEYTGEEYLVALPDLIRAEVGEHEEFDMKFEVTKEILIEQYLDNRLKQLVNERVAAENLAKEQALKAKEDELNAEADRQKKEKEDKEKQEKDLKEAETLAELNRVADEKEKERQSLLLPDKTKAESVIDSLKLTSGKEKERYSLKEDEVQLITNEFFTVIANLKLKYITKIRNI